MYEKFHGLPQEQADCAEELADVLYELSKDLYEKRQFELAATWLGRALDMLDGHELDRLSEHAGDLRLAVLQKLGQHDFVNIVHTSILTLRSQGTPSG